ncbi:MAG: hypothetical protein U9N51_04095 [Bacteroidota bacterium]|nr:hypothetical protein [Bacteroidota bacterium]
MKKHFLILSIFAGLFLSIFFVSCEKEDLEKVKETNSIDIELSDFIDMSYYSTQEGITIDESKGNEIDPPYRFVWQEKTLIILENGVCACLPTDSGDCLWEVTVRAKSNNIIYSRFLKYYNNDETKAFFEKENWHNLFPMLQESTVHSIINDELIIGHTKHQGSEISYFYFSLPGTDPSDSNNNLFTLQLNID